MSLSPSPLPSPHTPCLPYGKNYHHPHHDHLQSQQSPFETYIRKALTLIISIVLTFHITLILPNLHNTHPYYNHPHNNHSHPKKIYQHRWLLQSQLPPPPTINEIPSHDINHHTYQQQQDSYIQKQPSVRMKPNKMKPDKMKLAFVCPSFHNDHQPHRHQHQPHHSSSDHIINNSNKNNKDASIFLQGSPHLRYDCGYYALLFSPTIREYHSKITHLSPTKSTTATMPRDEWLFMWEWEKYGRDKLMESISNGIGDQDKVYKILEDTWNQIRNIDGEKLGRLDFKKDEMKRLLVIVEHVGRTVVMLRSLGICSELVGRFGVWLENVGFLLGNERKGGEIRIGIRKNVVNVNSGAGFNAGLNAGPNAGGGRKVDEIGWVLAIRAEIYGIEGNVGNGEYRRHVAQRNARKFVERLVKLQHGADGKGWLYHYGDDHNEFEKIYRHGLAAMYLTRLYAVTRSYGLHRLLASSLRRALNVKQLRKRLRTVHTGDEKKRLSLYMLYVDVLMKGGEVLREGKMMAMGREIAEWNLDISFTQKRGIDAFRHTPWKRCDQLPVSRGGLIRLL